MVTRILTPVRILRPEFITGGCVLDLKMDEGEGTVAHDTSGLIDEVRIYNRALSADEIRAHFLGARVPIVRQL